MPSGSDNMNISLEEQKQNLIKNFSKENPELWKQLQKENNLLLATPKLTVITSNEGTVRYGE